MTDRAARLERSMRWARKKLNHHLKISADAEHLDDLEAMRVHMLYLRCAIRGVAEELALAGSNTEEDTK